MTHSYSHLENYKSMTSMMYIGDDSSLSIIGVGDVPSGDAFLKEVLHVPQLSTNLFSISKAMSKGLGVYFDEDVIEVIDCSSLSLVANGYYSDGLHYISSFTCHMPMEDSHLHQLFASPKALLSKEENTLWHARFGHVPYDTLLQLFSKSMVITLPQLHVPCHQVCSSCALGKQHRASFPLTSTNRATRILELVHIDLVSPMEVPSLGGSRYYMLLVDDFSCKLRVYFLTHKSDALANFQHWKKKSNAKLSTLRSNNGCGFIIF